MRGLQWLIPVAAAVLIGCPAARDSDQTGTKAPADTAAKPAAGLELTVWADPLLEVPLSALMDDFSEQNGCRYDLLFMERGGLVTRVTSTEADSLRPDVFLVADGPTMTALREAGVVDEATARTFAGDSLALVQTAGKGYATETLFDIYRLPFDHLAVGTDDTAVGYYAHQALVTEGCFPRVAAKLKTFDHTADLVSALSGGEIPIGIITKSQYVQSDGLHLVLLISERLHEDIRYQAVAARGRGSDAAVMALLRFLAEDEQIQLKFGGFGLSDRQTALVEDK